MSICSRLLITTVFVGVLTGAQFACSGVESTERPAPSLASLRMPDEFHRRRFEAIELALADCMDRRGFDYLRAEYIAFGFEPADRRWGLLDADAAALNGYHLPAEVLAAEETSRQFATTMDAHLATMSAERRDAYSRALTGQPAVGARPLPPIPTELPSGRKEDAPVGVTRESCRFEALGSLPGRDAVSVEQEIALRALLQVLAGDSDRRAANSGAFLSVLESWRRCFSGRGFQAGDPLAAMEKYLSPGISASVEERDAATADVGCKVSTDFWSVWNLALEQAWQEVAESRQGDLQALLALQAEMSATLGP